MSSNLPYKFALALIAIAWLLAPAPVYAQAETSSARTQTAIPAVPVPQSVSWMTPVLLALMWLAIAAIVLGPIVRFFAPKPPAEPKGSAASY